jgi:hypothetical protein
MTPNKAMSSRLVITLAIVWQLVVYALSVAGIFVEIFRLLGIPWNSVGIQNVIGTAVGFLVLELPTIVLFVFWFRQRRQNL